MKKSTRRRKEREAKRERLRAIVRKFEREIAARDGRFWVVIPILVRGIKGNSIIVRAPTRDAAFEVAVERNEWRNVGTLKGLKIVKVNSKGIYRVITEQEKRK